MMMMMMIHNHLLVNKYISHIASYRIVGSVWCMQIVYHDLSGRWSYGIYVRDRERVKCLITEQVDAYRHATSTSHGVYQHCYTSAVLQLAHHDTVSIRCLYGSRSIIMQPGFTFWGLIQLSTASLPSSS